MGSVNYTTGQLDFTLQANTTSLLNIVSNPVKQDISILRDKLISVRNITVVINE